MGLCHVIQIVGPTKALQSIAAFTVERDGDIRKASLAALATAYKILGAFLLCNNLYVFFVVGV